MSWFAVIAVQNHVGQSFFHAQLHGKPNILGNSVPIGYRLDPRLDTAQLRELAIQFKPVLRIIHERLRLCVGCVRLVNARLARY
jgi:hypothetical protein